MNSTNLSELLPWYVNNTLSADERAQVDAWLATSPEAKAELAALQQLAQQIKAEALPEASDLGWQRLKRDMRAAPTQRNWWRPGLAAAAVLVMGLQVAVITRPEPQLNMQLLNSGVATSQDATSPVSAPSWLVQIELDPALNWAQATELLTALNGRLVDGPGSAGLVRVLIPKQGEAFANKEALEDYLLALPGVNHAAVEAEF
jgi:hypothetical protein